MQIGFLRTSLTDILHKVLGRLINKLVVVYRPTPCALWIPPKDLESLRTDEHVWTDVITCGGVRRGIGVQGWWGGINIALHRPPISGHAVGGWGGRRFSNFRLQGWWGRRQHCPSPNAHLGVHPRSWRPGRQEILQLLAPRRR